MNSFLRRVFLAAAAINAIRNRNADRQLVAQTPDRGAVDEPASLEASRTDDGRSVGTKLSAIGLSLLLLVLVGGGAYSYVLFRRSTQSPELPTDSGGLRLYFAQPGVEASIEATVVPQSFDETEIRYRIDLEKPTTKPVGFYLALTGNAIYNEHFPSGEPLPRLANGCPQVNLSSAWAEVSCQTTRWAPDSLFSDPSVRQPTRVISGKIDPASKSGTLALVTIYAGAKYSQTKGKRTYFQLPDIGTTYLPASGRADITFDLGNPEITAYVPKKLGVVVDYGDLSVADRIETMRPDSLIPGRLVWYESDASTVRASGSLVDISTEDRDQRNLFIIGVVVGILGSVIPSLVPPLFRRIRAATGRS